MSLPRGVGSGGGLLVGNLDCEEEWTALLAAAPGGPSRPRTLSAGARAAAAGAATLLRALAPGEGGETHRLWSLAEVGRERIASVPGLATVEPVTGRREELEPAAWVLGWGETPSVARLRGRPDGGEPAGGDPPAGLARLLRVPPAEPRVAARVNHRRFSLALGLERGWALPGARIVSSQRELTGHLEAAEWGEISGGAWLARAPLSAAGRDRVSGDGPEAARRPQVRSRLRGLLGRQGELLVEPLLERSADFGCSGLVEPPAPGGGLEPAVTLAAVHRLEVDRGGRFTGLALPPLPPLPGRHPPGGTGPEVPPAAPGMRQEELEALVASALAAGRALAAAGYTGPFGVDAFRWREAASGGERFHPLSEINARWTFGWIALALGERLRAAGAAGAGEPLALRFGRALPAPEPAGGGARIVPLLLPDERSGAIGGGAAWLALGPSEV